MGRHLVTGLPTAVEVSSIEIREAISGSAGIIIDTIKDALDDTPPELIGDLMESAIPVEASAKNTRCVRASTWRATGRRSCS